MSNGNRSTEGYANFVTPGPELSAFKRFDRLSSRNLLYLQSELLSLQMRLRDFGQDELKEKNGEIVLSTKC